MLHPLMYRLPCTPGCTCDVTRLCALRSNIEAVMGPSTCRVKYPYKKGLGHVPDMAWAHAGFYGHAKGYSILYMYIYIYTSNHKNRQHVICKICQKQNRPNNTPRAWLMRLCARSKHGPRLRYSHLRNQACNRAQYAAYGSWKTAPDDSIVPMGSSSGAVKSRSR